MQDLLGLPIEFGARLPEDGKSKDGFRNDGDALRMSPLQYETYLQIADEALAEAIVTGPPPVVHRYRLSVGEKHANYEVTPLPKPADRPGESFEYASQRKARRSASGTCPPGGGHRQRRSPIWDPPTAAALGDRAFQRGGRADAENAVSPSDCIRRSARAKPASRSVPRASSRQRVPTPPASPSLTVADRFDELSRRRAEDRRRADRHRSHRFPHLRVSGSHGERLGPEYGAAERQELGHPGRVELGQGDQGRVAAAAAEDRVDRVRESVFRNLAAERRTRTSCSPTTGLTRRRMPAKSCAASPRGPIAARSPRPNSIGS